MKTRKTIPFGIALLFLSPFAIDAGDAQAAGRKATVEYLSSSGQTQGACRVTRRGKTRAGIIGRSGKFVSLQSLKRKLRKRLKKAGSKRKKVSLRKKLRSNSQFTLLLSKPGRETLASWRTSCRNIGQAENTTPPATETPGGNTGNPGKPGKPGKPSNPKETPNPKPPVPPTPPAKPLPELAQWEAQMLEFGRRHCNTLQNNGSFDTRLAATYYDAQWVYQQIADYTKDPSWAECERAAERTYRDQYVLANNGRIPGYWNFTHGVMFDWLRTGDEKSKQAVKQLATNAAFAVDATPLSETAHADYSREVAYTIMAYLNAETVGEPRRARLAALVDQALGHMDQWFGKRNAPYIRPFMVALTSHALISYHDQVGDRDMVPVIRRAADWLWENTWNAGAGAFQYTDRNHSSGGTELAADLNLLIAPLYAWLYHQTGNETYLQRGDAIFAGGVRGSFLGNGKQFNQNYRWSFEFLRWRNSPPLR